MNIGGDIDILEDEGLLDDFVDDAGPAGPAETDGASELPRDGEFGPPRTRPQNPMEAAALRAIFSPLGTLAKPELHRA